MSLSNEWRSPALPPGADDEPATEAITRKDDTVDVLDGEDVLDRESQQSIEVDAAALARDILYSDRIDRSVSCTPDRDAMYGQDMEDDENATTMDNLTSSVIISVTEDEGELNETVVTREGAKRKAESSLHSSEISPIAKTPFKKTKASMATAYRRKSTPATPLENETQMRIIPEEKLRELSTEELSDLASDCIGKIDTI